MYGFNAGPLLNVVKITVVAWLTVMVCTALAWAGLMALQDSNSSANGKCVAELRVQGLEALSDSMCD